MQYMIFLTIKDIILTIHYFSIILVTECLVPMERCTLHLFTYSCEYARTSLFDVRILRFRPSSLIEPHIPVIPQTGIPKSKTFHLRSSGLTCVVPQTFQQHHISGVLIVPRFFLMVLLYF